MPQTLEKTRPGKAEADAKAKGPMHRKGSLKGHIDNPTSLPERLTSRRMELNLSQADVAGRVRFYNKKAAEWKDLSRSAYCMYESGDVTPDVDKITTLAEILQCTPQWLAFGDTAERAAIQEVEYDPDQKAFTALRPWPMHEDFLQAQYGVSSDTLALVRIDSFSEKLQPGEMAFVDRSATPSSAGGDFVYALKGQVMVDHITQPSVNGPLRVFEPDRRNYKEIKASQLTILGKMVGKIGV